MSVVNNTYTTGGLTLRSFETVTIDNVTVEKTALPEPTAALPTVLALSIVSPVNENAQHE